MIVRIWHGRTKTQDAEIYCQYVTDSGMKDYTSVPGNLGAQIWQRAEGEITHIWTVSWWNDIESIRAFAGEEIQAAKYYEDDKRYLLEFEPTVEHCDAFDFGKREEPLRD